MQTKVANAFLCLLTWGTLILSIPAHAELRPDDKVPNSPRLVTGKLPNGLTYYIQKNARPANKVELRLVVKVGSMQEDDDQRGLAHFLEHMAFSRSKNFEGRDLSQFMNQLGVRMGPGVNATTSYDETIYTLSLPTDRKDTLDRAFLLMSDWAGGILFDPAEIEKERNVVLEEARLRKGAAERMRQAVVPRLLEGTRYVNRLPIGTEESIKTFPYDALKRFYREWYRPELMAVIAVGDVEPAEIDALVRKHFAGLQNPPDARPRTYAELPQRSAPDAIIVTDREAPNNVLTVLLSRLPRGDETTFAMLRARLTEALMVSMLSQRLAETSQRADAPFTGAFATIFPLMRNERGFSIGAVLGKEGYQPAVAAIMQEAERAARFGFTQSELDRVKRVRMAQMESAYQERANIYSATVAAELQRNFLVGEPAPGLENELAYLKEMLPAISLAEVSAAARNAIRGNGNKLVIYQGTEGKDLPAPSAAQLLAAVNADAGPSLAAYEEKALPAQLMDARPAAGAIRSKKLHASLNMTEIEFANGVKAFLKPTDFRNDQVMMTAIRPGGRALFPAADFRNAQYASTLVREMGVKDFSPNELRKIFAGKAANAAPSLSDISEGFAGQSGNADIEAMLQLTYLYFTQPRKDAALFDSFVAKQRELTRNSLVHPDVAFNDEFLRLMFNDDPRGPRVPRPEDFEQIRLDRALEIYRQRFGSAKGFQFVIVGAFDVEKITPLLAAYLGSLPAGDVPVVYKDSGLRPVKGIVKKEIRLGTEQKSTVRINITGEAPYSPEANLRLRMLVEVLRQRLSGSLRGGMGAAYTMSASGQMVHHPYGAYVISMNVPCAPENVEKVVKAINFELDRIKEDGVLPSDLRKLREAWLKSHQESVKNNAYWLGGIRAAIENGEAPERLLEYEAVLNAVTPAELNQAAQTFFDMKNVVQLVQYPVAK